MAYTFDEVFANLPALADDEYPFVASSLVITQEDGRTGFAEGEFGVDPATETIAVGVSNADSAFDLFISFSDRNRFQGNADHIGLEIRRGGAGDEIEVRHLLKTWGAEYEQALTLVGNSGVVGKLYTGFGPTIGWGTGRALHCLSFHSTGKRKVVLL